MDNPRAQISWRDGVPISDRFNDPYFSLHDGLAETRHVFLAGNDLPGRFCPGFHVAELGFGTGLNLLATWSAWVKAGIKGPLRFTSFEGFAMSRDDMAAALAAFPELSEFAAPLIAAWDYGVLAPIEGLELQVILGDVRQSLPQWTGVADAWFLDGFAPSENPDMWQADVMAEVGKHTKPNGTFATYTAAGVARRGLADAGFAVERVPGFGGKRHMSMGRMA